MAKNTKLNFESLDLGDLNRPASPGTKDSQFKRVTLAELYEDPDNPRTEFNEEFIRNLAEDIAEAGLLQPIVVRPKDTRGHKIVHGANRYRALKILEKEGRLPSNWVVYEHPNADLDIFAQISENEMRVNLSPMDLAIALSKVITAGTTRSEVARRLQWSGARVTELMSLLELPPALLALYQEHRCRNPQVLYALLSLYKSFPDRVTSVVSTMPEISRTDLAIIERATQGHAPASGTGGATAASTNVSTKGKPQAPVSKDINVVKLEERITQSIGARTRVQYSDKTKFGTLHIRFTSLEELDGLLERMKIPKE